MWAEQNPFNPNGAVPTNLFAGRKDYCWKILRKISETSKGRSSSFYLFGERGIGKSALAKLIGYAASKKDKDFYDLNFLVSYYTVERGQRFVNVLEASLNSLLDDAPDSFLKRVGNRVGNLFKNGKFSIGAFGAAVSYEGGPEARNESVNIRDQLISIITNSITALKESSALNGDKKDGFLIIIDEMQNLADIESAASLLRGVLSTLDFKDSGYISFLLIGLEQSFQNFMSGDESARRAFDPILLDVMPLDEAMDVLEKGFSSVNIKWDQNVLKSNIYVTGGYPHSIQVIGHNLIDCDMDGFIDEQDWIKAITKTAYELREKEFSSMYSFTKKWTNREKILNIIALLGHMPRKELAEKCKKAYEISNCYQYLPQLEKVGAIRVRQDGTIELHSHLFRTAILSVLIGQLKNFPILSDMWYEQSTNKVS